jgi:hypothetical protein
MIRGSNSPFVFVLDQDVTAAMVQAVVGTHTGTDRPAAPSRPSSCSSGPCSRTIDSSTCSGTHRNSTREAFAAWRAARGSVATMVRSHDS